MRVEGLEPDVASFQAVAYGCRTEKDVGRLLEMATVRLFTGIGAVMLL